jgi:hypothetical protein
MQIIEYRSIEYRLPKLKTNALERKFFYSTLKDWNTLVEEKNSTFKVMKSKLHHI